MNILNRLSALFHITDDISGIDSKSVTDDQVISFTGTGASKVAGVSSSFYVFTNTTPQGSMSNQTGTLTLGSKTVISTYAKSRFIKGATPASLPNSVTAFMVGGGGGTGGVPSSHSSGGGGAGRLVFYNANFPAQGTLQITTGSGGQATQNQAGRGIPGNNSSIQSFTAGGGGGGGTSSGQPAGQYGGANGGSGGGGGAGHNNQWAGGAEDPGTVSGATFNEGSPGSPNAGVGGGSGRNMTDYGMTSTNLGVPGLAPLQGTFAHGGGQPLAQGTGIQGSGNGSYGPAPGGHGIVVIRTSSPQTFRKTT